MDSLFDSTSSDTVQPDGFSSTGMDSQDRRVRRSALFYLAGLFRSNAEQKCDTPVPASYEKSPHLGASQPPAPLKPAPLAKDAGLGSAHADPPRGALGELLLFALLAMLGCLAYASPSAHSPSSLRDGRGMPPPLLHIEEGPLSLHGPHQACMARPETTISNNSTSSPRPYFDAVTPSCGPLSSRLEDGPLLPLICFPRAANRSEFNSSEFSVARTRTPCIQYVRGNMTPSSSVCFPYEPSLLTRFLVEMRSTAALIGKRLLANARFYRHEIRTSRPAELAHRLTYTLRNLLRAILKVWELCTSTNAAELNRTLNFSRNFLSGEYDDVLLLYYVAVLATGGYFLSIDLRYRVDRWMNTYQVLQPKRKELILRAVEGEVIGEFTTTYTPRFMSVPYLKIRRPACSNWCIPVELLYHPLVVWELHQDVVVTQEGIDVLIRRGILTSSEPAPKGKASDLEMSVPYSKMHKTTQPKHQGIIHCAPGGSPSLKDVPFGSFGRISHLGKTYGITATHVAVDIMKHTRDVEFGKHTPIFLRVGKVDFPLPRSYLAKPTAFSPTVDGLDAVLFELPQSFWAQVGLKAMKTASQVVEGLPVTVFTPLANATWVKSIGTVETAHSLFKFYHSASTDYGASGSLVVSKGRALAVHVQRCPGKSLNCASALFPLLPEAPLESNNRQQSLWEELEPRYADDGYDDYDRYDDDRYDNSDDEYEQEVLVFGKSGHRSYHSMDRRQYSKAEQSHNWMVHHGLDDASHQDEFGREIEPEFANISRSMYECGGTTAFLVATALSYIPGMNPPNVVETSSIDYQSLAEPLSPSGLISPPPSPKPLPAEDESEVSEVVAVVPLKESLPRNEETHAPEPTLAEDEGDSQQIAAVVPDKRPSLSDEQLLYFEEWLKSQNEDATGKINEESKEPSVVHPVPSHIPAPEPEEKEEEPLAVLGPLLEASAPEVASKPPSVSVPEPPVPLNGLGSPHLQKCVEEALSKISWDVIIGPFLEKQMNMSSLAPPSAISLVGDGNQKKPRRRKRNPSSKALTNGTQRILPPTPACPPLRHKPKCASSNNDPTPAC